MNGCELSRAVQLDAADRAPRRRVRTRGRCTAENDSPNWKSLKQLVEAGDLEVRRPLMADERRPRLKLSPISSGAGKSSLRRTPVVMTAVIAAVNRRPVEAGVGEGDARQRIEARGALASRRRDAQLESPSIETFVDRRAAPMAGRPSRGSSSASPHLPRRRRRGYARLDVEPLEADAGHHVEVASPPGCSICRKAETVLACSERSKNVEPALVAVLQDLVRRARGRSGWSCPGIRSGCRPGYPA